MKAIGFFISILFLQLQSSAQELWLEPQKFSYQAGEKNFIRFRSGENFVGQNWTGSRENIALLRAFSTNYQYDLLPFMGMAKGDSARLDTMNFAGNFTIAYQSQFSQQQMDAASFNAMLNNNGLANVLLWRQENNKDTAMGKFSFQQSAKALVRIKSTMKKSDYMKSSFIAYSVSLPLEIVPLDNPYNIKEATTMQFNIFLWNRPARDGLVKVWHTVNGHTEVKTLQVIKGLVDIPLEPTGSWMISIVKMDPIKNNPTADWQGYSSSLSFNYE